MKSYNVSNNSHDLQSHICYQPYLNQLSTYTTL